MLTAQESAGRSLPEWRPGRVAVCPYIPKYAARRKAVERARGDGAPTPARPAVGASLMLCVRAVPTAEGSTEGHAPTLEVGTIVRVAAVDAGLGGTPRVRFEHRGAWYWLCVRTGGGAEQLRAV